MCHSQSLSSCANTATASRENERPLHETTRSDDLDFRNATKADQDKWTSRLAHNTNIFVHYFGSLSLSLFSHFPSIIPTPFSESHHLIALMRLGLE
jgi:hypothetical protein